LVAGGLTLIGLLAEPSKTEFSLCCLSGFGVDALTKLLERRNSRGVRRRIAEVAVAASDRSSVLSHTERVLSKSRMERELVLS
jgi:hypothetical protein